MKVLRIVSISLICLVFGLKSQLTASDEKFASACEAFEGADFQNAHALFKSIIEESGPDLPRPLLQPGKYCLSHG